MFEEKVEEEVKEVAPKVEGDDEEAAADEAPEDGEPKGPSWKPTDFRWSVTNGRSKNLPQLIRDYMGNRCNFEDKNWKQYGSTSHSDAAVKALDDFCQKLTDEGNTMNMYQQVIFNDLD